MQVVSTPFVQQERGLDLRGPQGPQGFQGPQGLAGAAGGGIPDPIELPTLASGTTKIVARDHIEAYSLICMNGYICDSNNQLQQSTLAGVAMDEAWPGMEVLVCFHGIIQWDGWNWAPNQKLWADGKWFNPQVPTSGWNQLIGMTLSHNTVFIRLSHSVLL